jgi:hypothetical protein
MAKQEPKDDDVLTKVARTLGTALGTVASAAAEITGSEPEPAPKPERATQPPAAEGRKAASLASNTAHERAQAQKKAKRAKHKRKLHRKTAG